MKKVLFLIALIFGVTAAAADSSPFHPSTDERFRKLENEQMLRIVYDVAQDGGSVGTTVLQRYSLPANAIIEQSFYQIITGFSDSGSGTVAFGCEDSGNILSAKDITGLATGAITSANESGTAATMTGSIAAACRVAVTVGGVNQLTGKLIMWVRYVVSQ